MNEPLDDLSCNELVELVTAYLEDALSDEDRTRVELHLVACDGCDAYVEQMRHTVDTIARVEPAAASPASTEALLDAFRGWRTQRLEDG